MAMVPSCALLQVCNRSAKGRTLAVHPAIHLTCPRGTWYLQQPTDEFTVWPNRRASTPPSLLSGWIKRHVLFGEVCSPCTPSFDLRMAPNWKQNSQGLYYYHEKRSELSSGPLVRTRREMQANPPLCRREDSPSVPA